MKTVDFEKNSVVEIYKEAIQAVEYYQDVIDSITQRMIEGEQFDGLELTTGSKRRVITEEGEKRLVEEFGEEKIYIIKKQLITLKEFDKLISKEKQDEYISIEYGKPKVKVKE